MKYVIVSGGVVSGLGKGITSSSVGVLLQACSLHITSIKIDPYLNTDAGTMSPYEHGEVFVLNDGGEADLDLGNYERFLDVTLTKDHNITTGKVYAQVINRERKGDYLGKTVQVVPHITDAIQDWIHRVAHIPVDGSNKPPDVCMIELGGTVGDIESMVFLEALQPVPLPRGQRQLRAHPRQSLVPVVGAVGEPKSKPTQHGVRELRAAGLQPDRHHLPLHPSHWTAASSPRSPSSAWCRPHTSSPCTTCRTSTKCRCCCTSSAWPLSCSTASTCTACLPTTRTCSSGSP